MAVSQSVAEATQASLIALLVLENQLEVRSHLHHAHLRFCQKAKRYHSSPIRLVKMAMTSLGLPVEMGWLQSLGSA